ncbi:hypothetical protein D9M68_330870 [compost metagenome]
MCQTPAITPLSGLRISSSHSSSKAALRFLRSCASISGRSFSRRRALTPATPRDSTVPATRPSPEPTTLAALLLASSPTSCSLVFCTTEAIPAFDAQSPAPPGARPMRSISATYAGSLSRGAACTTWYNEAPCLGDGPRAIAGMPLSRWSNSAGGTPWRRGMSWSRSPSSET